MFLLVYPLGHVLFCIACIVLHHFFCRNGITILMSGAYWLHMRCYGGDGGHLTACSTLVTICLLDDNTSQL